MKSIRLLLLVLLTIASLSPLVRAETVEKIVAIVGNDIITLYELDSAMASKLSEIKNSADRENKYKTVKREVLEKLIDDKLMKQAISSSKTKVTNDDVAKQIKSMLAQNHITIDVLKAELAKKGISYESYKEDIKRNMEHYRFINEEIGPRIKINDQDMKDYYAKHLDEFGVNASVHIALIVLPFDDTTTKESALQLKANGEEIVRTARGGVSFATLAKQYSKGPNASSGGDLGIVDPANLLPEVQNVLEKMKTGQISDPVASPAGIHIVQLLERGKATESDFEKMKDRIYNKIYDNRIYEELDQYLSDLRKKTYVEIRE